MKRPNWVPTWDAIGKEALIVIGGAIAAAFIIGNMPTVKAWIAKQWGDTPRGF